MKSIIMNASFAFFIALSSTAHAQPPSQLGIGQQEVVTFRDLDISREAGARVALNRLEVASSRVCGGWPDMHVLEQVVRYHACTRQAMAGALAQLGSAKLNALYGVPAERLAMSH